MIWNCNGYLGIIVKNNTLTGKAALDPWIDGPVNKILLFIGNAFNKILPFFNIQVAG